MSFAAIADDRPYLVRDLPGVTVKDSMSYGRPLWTTLGDTTWFVASIDSQTMEVFKTDGSTAGTVRVTHGIGSPDRQWSGPFLGVTHGKLVYGGRDAGGVGLFALDTAGGEPVLLARISTQYLTNGVVRGGMLYFSARKTAGSEHELWRTDGTLAGTETIDLMPGENGAFDSTRDARLFALGETIFFYGTTFLGTGLHRTDGTSQNTTLLFPLTTSELYNNTGEVFALGGRLLFFLSRQGERKDALWSTDGTPSGTQAIAEVPGFEPLGVLGGNLLFEDSRRVIWTTDGLLAGTRKTDVLAGENLVNINAGGVLGNRLYFFASGFFTQTLYVTEGTASTTQAVMPVKQNFHVLGEGFVLGGKFFFRHNDGIHGMELWMTDGTTTQILADVNPSHRSGIDSASAALRPDGTAIFVATTFDAGREPWITDGTAAGTRLLANIAAEDPTHGSSPFLLRASGERVFFVATLTGGQAIGVSDGTNGGTTATIVDFDWTIHSAAATGHRYFFSTSVADPFGLYATDGTIAGTTGIYEGTTTPSPLRDGVLFKGSDAIWFSDGTLAGMRRLRDVSSTSSTRIFPAGDVAWFYSSSVWKTDGTEAGTVEIVPAEPRNGEIFDLIRSGASFFMLETSSFPSGPKLWRSDGTSAGTRVVKVLESPQNTPTFVGATDHLVYFNFNGKLQRSDGTEAGTLELPVSFPCAGSAVLGDAFIFSSATVNGVLTLWRSDGTAAGTTKLMTMSEQNSPFSCLPLAALGGRVYFSGRDAAHGWEPWVTDGTVSGTKLLADLYPGTKGSVPKEWTVAGDRVFFSADSPNTGRELWAIGPHPSARRRAVGAR